MKTPNQRATLSFAVIALCVVCARSAGAGQEPRVLSAKDTLRLNQVGSPRLSPDGEWVLYTQRTRDMEDDQFEQRTQVWRVRTDGTARRQLTQARSDSRAPAWSPDGALVAFLAARPGTESGDDPRTQVHVMPADGGEAYSVTAHDEAVTSFRFSPAGGRLLFLARDGETEEEERRRTERDDALVVDETFRGTHLWVQNLQIDEMVEISTATRLTGGPFTVANPDWSPDARQIAYERRPNPTANDRWKSDIWVADVESGQGRVLYANGGSDVSPRWSPNGRTIAFGANEVEASSTMFRKLYLISPEGGEPRTLLEQFDNQFTTPIWSPDGRRIFWSSGQGTSTTQFAVSIESGAVTAGAVPTGRNGGWDLSTDGTRWVWIHASPGWPAEVYTVGRDLADPLRLTDANAWLRDEAVELGAVETVQWRNSDGQTIEGVLTKPVGYEEGRRYPFIVNPHGGPSGASLEAFNAQAQFFAGNGYVVLQPNFRGSTNYGQDFVNANIDNWGVTDYDDVMTGVDYVIAAGWADPDRLICYGWSYGGYMSFWISTQTDRFKAISAGAGLANLYSMYSTNDLQDYLASFFGRPWTDEDRYRRHSPIRHVANVTSPMLILHGSADTRVPVEQSVEFYQALKDLGKDVTFVRYPREGHGFTEPRHVMNRLQRYAEFFGEHVDNPPVSELDIDAETDGEDDPIR